MYKQCKCRRNMTVGTVLVYAITMLMNIGASLFLLSLVIREGANIDLSSAKDLVSLLLFAPWVTLLYLLVFEQKKDDDESLLALWLAVKKKKLKDQLNDQ
ncbi:MAG TPA: hypothetical protein DEX20_08485 [Halieaceae bacterium]|nr:hypothetical protein [Halieaceae bacterium]